MSNQRLSRKSVNRLGLLALLSLVAAGLAYQMFTRVDRPYLDERVPRHEAIVDHTAEEPYRYRVLVPAAAEFGVEILAPRIGNERAFLASYLAYDFVAILTSLLGVVALLSALGFASGATLAGTLLFAYALGMTMQDQWFQPWSLVEPGLLAVGLAAGLRGRWGVILMVTTVYAFTRETAVLLGVGAVLVAPRAWWSWGSLALTVGLAALLRYWIGPGQPEITLPARLALNMDPGHIRLAVQGVVLVLGPAVFMSLAGLREAPATVRRLALLVPFYVALIAAFGVWHEARLWLPMVPVAIALSWYRLFPPSLDSGAARA